MPDSLYSIRVYLRRTPQSPWIYQQSFATGQAAADWIAAEKRRGRLAGETLCVMGDRNPNKDK